MTQITLTPNQAELLKKIYSDAKNMIRDNAEGSEYVRIKIYRDVFEQQLSGENLEAEVIGVHIFSSHQWDDIEYTEDLFSFEQEKEITDEDHFNDWVNEAYKNEIRPTVRRIAFEILNSKNC